MKSVKLVVIGSHMGSNMEPLSLVEACLKKASVTPVMQFGALDSDGFKRCERAWCEISFGADVTPGGRGVRVVACGGMCMFSQ